MLSHQLTQLIESSVVEASTMLEERRARKIRIGVSMLENEIDGDAPLLNEVYE